MTIGTYTLLQSAVASWLGRSDLTATIPDFVSLFEAYVNRALRVRQMETLASITMSEGAGALPSDFIAWKRVTWTGSPRRELEYVHPSYLQASNPSQISDLPCRFTIEADQISVAPSDDTALEMLYWARVPALADTPTNWLLSTYPDLYLFGTLVEANAFILNADGAALWKGRRDELIGEIKSLDMKHRGPASIKTASTVV